MALPFLSAGGNRDDGQPPQRGDFEQLFGAESQAATLASVVRRRAAGSEYRTTTAWVASITAPAPSRATPRPASLATQRPAVSRRGTFAQAGVVGRNATEAEDVVDTLEQSLNLPG
jgi:hypothetical protein